MSHPNVFYAVRCTILDKALEDRGLHPNGFWLVPGLFVKEGWTTLLGPAPMGYEEAVELAEIAAKQHPEARFEAVKISVTVIPL